MINTEIANDENVSLNDGGTLSGNLIFPKFFCLKIRYISTVKIPTNKPTIIPFPSKYVKSVKDIPYTNFSGFTEKSY